MLCGFVSAVLIFIGLQLQGPHFEITLPGQSQPMISFGSPGEKVLLVMGVDAPNRDLRRKNEDAFEGTRTDTIALVRVDAHKRNVTMVSIPRDSKVYLAGGRGIDKINAAHAIGGPELAVQTVQESFGIPIDNFVVINLRGVRELVDAVGGIDVYVEKPMHYDDYTAKLHVHFEPGVHHLDGKQAEAFLRFRHDALGDIGRIRRQQQFAMAVAKKAKNPLLVAQIPQLVNLANQYLETDLSINDMITLAFFAKDVNWKGIRTATLPGHPGGITVSYWIVEPEAAQKVLDRLILDNPGASSDRYAEAGPLKVGIFYDPMLVDGLPVLEKALQAKQFQVVCKQRQRRASTVIVEHSERVTNDLTERLRRSDHRLGNARLIFAPVGTTFENNACSAAEDYTLVLGGDLVRKH